MPKQTEDEAPRMGRRSGANTTREEVLHAARARFAKEGYAATSIRAVAADAGVDPALVMQFYKSKDGLFAASLDLSDVIQDRVSAAFDAPKEQLGEGLAYNFLTLWEEGPNTNSLMATLRGATSNEFAAGQLSDFIQGRLLAVIGPKLGDGPDSAARAGIVISMLMGLILARSVVGVPLVANQSREEVARKVGPAIQTILTGV